jgi:hypothetical protein
MSPEWQDYAWNVDRLCATNYNHTLDLTQEVAATAEQRGWPNSKRAAATDRLWAANQAALHDAVIDLGAPPAKPGLLSRWVSNVGRRGELFAASSRAASRRDERAYVALDDRISTLKDRADVMGQRFGLRICTSN